MLKKPLQIAVAGRARVPAQLCVTDLDSMFEGSQKHCGPSGDGPSPTHFAAICLRIRMRGRGLG